MSDTLCTVNGIELQPCWSARVRMGDGRTLNPGGLLPIISIVGGKSVLRGLAHRIRLEPRRERFDDVALNYCPWCGANLRAALVGEREPSIAIGLRLEVTAQVVEPVFVQRFDLVPLARPEPAEPRPCGVCGAPGAHPSSYLHGGHVDTCEACEDEAQRNARERAAEDADPDEEEH